MSFIDGKPYGKLPGTACLAPYVNIRVSDLSGRRSADIFKARIDPGADITCIPKSQAEKLMPLLLGKPVLIRGHDGSVKRAWTYRVIISVHGCPGEEQVKSYRPERGVLLTDSHIGLIGMDIIKHWMLTLDGSSQMFSVKCLDVSHQ